MIRLRRPVPLTVVAPTAAAGFDALALGHCRTHSDGRSDFVQLKREINHFFMKTRFRNFHFCIDFVI